MNVQETVPFDDKYKFLYLIFRWGEAYTWTNVNCCVHNIIVGKLWMEQYGTMEVVNHKTGHRAVLIFKPAGWASKDLHRVEGFIYDKKYDLIEVDFHSNCFNKILFAVKRNYISSMESGLNS